MFVCTHCSDTYDEHSPGVRQQGKHWLCPRGHPMLDTKSRPGERWLLSIVAMGACVLLAYVLMMTKHSYAESMNMTAWQIAGILFMVVYYLMLSVIGIALLRGVYCLLKALAERLGKGVAPELSRLDFAEGMSAILSVVVNSALFVSYIYICATLFDRAY